MTAPRTPLRPGGAAPAGGARDAALAEAMDVVRDVQIQHTRPGSEEAYDALGQVLAGLRDLYWSEP